MTSITKAISLDFNNVSMFDLIVVTMWGWKVYGHADISWWWVFSPWLFSAAVVVVTVVFGIAKLQPGRAR